MSRTCCKQILKAFKYTNQHPGTYINKFHGIKQDLNAWNNNMSAVYWWGWVNCFLSVHDGLGLAVCLPMLHDGTFHASSFWVHGTYDLPLVFRVEFVKGMDSPPERLPKEEYEKSKTIGLNLRLTKVFTPSSSSSKG
jgi:hypothetical protein